LAELGYGFAYRVLDAQYFGVAQRRRRVFVVANVRSWQRAAAVLFESHSLQGHPAPSRQARQGAARGVGGSPADGSISGAVTRKWAKGSGGPAGDECYNMVAQPVAGSHWDSPANPHPTLNQSAKGSGGIAASDQELFSQRGSGLVAQPVAYVGGVDYENNAHTFAIQATVIGRDEHSGPNGLGADATGAMFTLTKTDVHAVAQPVAMNVYGGNKREDRPEGGFYVRMDEDTSKTLDAASGLNPTCSQGGTAVMQPIAFGVAESDSVAHCLRSGASKADKHESTTYVAQTAMQVRRLTPVECERLQGFPDGYTNIPWRKSPESPDGPRYKALGNSMAVPVMAWIGNRIKQVSEL
jgi:DNA (cytosine-5)-methyltransferase 1